MDVSETINQLRDILIKLNLSNWSLLFFGALFLISFLLSTREILCWFLKVPTLKKEIRNLRSQVTELQTEIKVLSERGPLNEAAVVTKPKFFNIRENLENF